MNLERIIYSICYYWYGIPKSGVQIIIWLFDKMYNLEWFDWTLRPNAPYHEDIANTIASMIDDGHLRITDRWVLKYGRVGLEPIFSKNSPEIYQPSERFDNTFRMIIQYLVANQDDYLEAYNFYKDRPMNKQTFFEQILKRIREDM